jgi:peptide methionine sulfoxide reductase MsrA
MALISPGETMRNPETGIAEGALVAHWQVKDLKVSKVLELLISCLQPTDFTRMPEDILSTYRTRVWLFQGRQDGKY